MISTTDFLIMVAIACGCVCIFLAWVAWPVKYKKKKVDTRKRDKEIDELLNFDVTDKIYD